MIHRTPSELTRRHAIKGMLSITAGVAGTALLAACGGGTAGGTGTAATAGSAVVTATSGSTPATTSAATSSATASAAATTTGSTAATTSASAATSAASTAAASAASVGSAAAAATGAIAKGGTIKIGIDLPITGADASDGVPAENGAKLAIDQANAKAQSPAISWRRRSWTMR